MKILYNTTLAICLATVANAQTWTKISNIIDSTEIRDIGITNSLVMVNGNNKINSTEFDFFVSSDGGNTWSEAPTFAYASSTPFGLPQNDIMLSGTIAQSYKYASNAWSNFSGGYAYAEFTNGTILCSAVGFPSTLKTISATGVLGADIGTQTFKIGFKYCNGANNRLFLYSYGSGLGYIDYSNLSTIVFPATLDGVAMTETSWQAKYILDMVKTSDGTLLAIDALGYGLFKSTDNGVNWITINTLSAYNGASRSIAKNTADEIFLLSNGGVASILKSTDLGTSFTDISGNLPTTGAFKKQMFVNANNDVFVFISSNGNVDSSKSGIYKLDGNSVGIKEANNSSFNLFPNPTNGILNINLESSTTPSSVEIINMLGQTIYSQKITENNTQINMSNFTKGIYFVTVKSNNKVNTQKVIVN